MFYLNIFDHEPFYLKKLLCILHNTIWEILAHLFSFLGWIPLINTKTRLIMFFAAKDGEALYSQQKQDQELTVAQIMYFFLSNSDSNWRK